MRDKINEELFKMKKLMGVILENNTSYDLSKNKKKKIFVLVGPPSVGKSTWVKKTFREIEPYIISRDDIVDSVADKYGWSYDDMFVAPPVNAEVGSYNEKYGGVIPSPSSVPWSRLSYTNVLDANDEINKRLADRIAQASGEQNIVIDMTNMTAKTRRKTIYAIKGHNQYEKIAVVFNFKGIEDLIMKVAQKRAMIAKEMGKSKTIPDRAFTQMFSSFQEVTPEEGFDDVINVDNTKNLLDALKD